MVITKYKIKYFLIVVLAILVLSCRSISYAEEYEYDDNGRVVSVKHDDGSVTSYEYDKNGNIISVETNKNNTKESQEESVNPPKENSADIVDSNNIAPESNSNFTSEKKEDFELNEVQDGSSKSVTPDNPLNRTIDKI